MHDSWEDDLSEADKEQIQAELEYEVLFYKLLTGSEKFEIIPLPDPSGENLTHKELKYIENQCAVEGIKLLYRVSHGNKVATILNSDTKMTGLVPEDSDEGFFC